MTNADGKRENMQDLEAEVWNAIAAFEQILEAMPTDRVSLETLADAYEKVGDHTRAKDYLVRLANVLVDESDRDAAGALMEKLKKYQEEDAEVRKVIERIGKLAPGRAEGVKSGAEKKPSAQHVAVNITGELSFAWNLLQARELTQEEYSQVVQELSDSSTQNGMVTVSVLHVLQDHQFPTMNRIMAYAAKECATPMVGLSNFEVREDTAKALPLEFAIRRGAIVFEVLGRDALVVVMNPYDQQLRKDIEGMLSRACHFFLTPPPEFDKAIEKMKELGKEQKGKGK